MVDETHMPQEAVKFVFPNEESAFGSLEALIEQGLEEDAILEGQRDAKVGAIVDELQGVRFSLQDDLFNILDANSSASDIAIAVEDLIEKYPASVMIQNILGEYRRENLTMRTLLMSLGELLTSLLEKCRRNTPTKRRLLKKLLAAFGLMMPKNLLILQRL